MRTRSIALCAGAVGILGLVACVVGAILDWGHFARAWLFAIVFWIAFPLGALPALFTHDLTGGGWGELAGPALQAMTATLPLLLAAFIPLFFAMDVLFPWSAPSETLPEVVRRKLLYLNLPFFIVRFCIYSVVWLGMVWFVHRKRRAPGAAAGCAILWLITLTFFAFDWLMSLTPKFYSDIFGMVIATSFMSSAACLLMLSVSSTGMDDEPIFAGRRRDLANLWLTVLCGWMFMAFSQYILIWSGNMPHEILWYLHRGAGAWRWFSWASVVLLFAIPLAVLISSSAKGSGRALTTLACATMIGHVAHSYWLVMPSFHQHGIEFHWLQPAAWLALGGLSGAFFLWRISLDRTDRGRAYV